MPGTLVRDALADNLLTGATLNSAGTTNGTAVQVSKPGCVRVELATSTVTGTNPTILVTLQGSSTSGFSSSVYLGSFVVTSGNAAAQTSITRYIDVDCYHEYIRANVTLGGTSPVYTGSTVKLRQENDHRTATDSA